MKQKLRGEIWDTTLIHEAQEITITKIYAKIDRIPFLCESSSRVRVATRKQLQDLAPKDQLSIFA